MSDTVYLIDGSGYIFRAFYAPMSPLSAPDGTPTKAVIGFAKMIRKLFRERNPSIVGMTFDPKGPSFRKEMYEDYKANRHETPEDLIPQLPLIREFVQCLDMPVLEMPGFEADDVIATLTHRARQDGHQVVIVSADKDLMQLVDDQVQMYDPMRDKHYDSAAVVEKFGVPPEQLLDLLALTGDTADNIPGVPKVGPKSAAKLILEFGDVESILQGLPEKAKLKAFEKSVLEHAEDARLSKELVKLNTTVPIETSWEALQYKAHDPDKLGPFLKKVGAFRLMQEFGIDAKQSGTTLAAPTQRPKDAPVYGPPPPSLIPDFSKIHSETVGDWKDFAAALKQSGAQTLALSYCHDDDQQITGISIAWTANEMKSYYFPCGHQTLDAGPQFTPEQLITDLVSYLQSDDSQPNKQIAIHDAKKLCRIDARFYALLSYVSDTLVQSFIVDPSRASYALTGVARNLFNHPVLDLKDLLGSGKKKKSPSMLPPSDIAPVLNEQAAATLWLHAAYAEQLAATDSQTLYADLEAPLLKVLYNMETQGIHVDPQALRSLQQDFSQRLKQLEAEAFSVAEEEFNLGSPKQLGHILFEKLGLEVIKRTKTGYSTDAEVLEKLSHTHPLPKIILQHRELAKLQSTYVDDLLLRAQRFQNRIHTTFNQSGAATGRLSSTDPNLQNIPIRTTDGKKIRTCFIASDHHKLISADYSQIELRVMAHLSLDPLFLDAFKRDEDIHRRTAMQVLTHGEEPSPEDRRKAKAINFGILYGLSEYGLSKQLGISIADAKDFIGRYFARYPGIRNYLEQSVEEARDRGWATTLLGRRRYLPDLRSRNQHLRQAAERIAMNTPIQGSAADIIKLAMLDVDKNLHAQAPEAKLLLQVHDELVLECPEEQVQTVCQLVKDAMQKVLPLAVPLVVDIEAGDNWAVIH